MASDAAWPNPEPESRITDTPAAFATPGAPTTPTMPTTPGWYHDPNGASRLRWWDGTSWSFYVMTNGTIAWDSYTALPTRREPAGVRRVGQAIGGYVIGVALGAALAVLMVALDRPGGRPTAMAVSQAGLWSGFLGACVLVSRRRGTGSMVTDFGWAFRPIDIGFGFAGSLVGRLLTGYVVAPLAYALRHTARPSNGVFHKLVSEPGGWIVFIVLTCVGAPIIEELFFRGLVQTRLIGRFGAVTGIAITSVLFGAAHLIGWQGPLTIVYALGVTAAGVVMGSMRYMTGRLGTSIMTHMFFNIEATLAIAYAWNHGAGS